MTKEKNKVSQKCWDEWISKKAVVNAGIVIVNSKKQVLLLFKNNEKEWGIPSGCIDKGEEPEETAIRELEEETSIKLSKEQLKKLIIVPAKHDKGKHDIVFTFLAYLVNNSYVRLSSEHVKSQWLLLRNYSDKNVKMHEATRKQLKSAYESIYEKTTKCK